MTSLQPQSPQGKDETFESPPETAVNTTNPSPSPSVRGSTSQSDLEAGDEKKIETSEGQFDPLSCIDPVTHVVGWYGPDDPENPMNFSQGKKWWITIILALVTFCVSFASSVFSTATVVTSAQFHVSTEVMILGVSLYVLGFAFGMSLHTRCCV